jgi:uncharacterized protein
MWQVWRDLLFAHWPVPLEALRVAIPQPLEIDTFEGRAWLGIVPFRMTGVRPKGLPAIPGISAFPELNVRTYVKFGAKPGVWFLSLDAGSHIAVALARRIFNLPYFFARMKVRASDTHITYSSRRKDEEAPPAELQLSYHPAGEVFQARPGTLAHFLTERYCLYALDERRIFRTEIHHAPWPLQPAEADFAVNSMAEAHELRLPATPPLLYFAKRQEVQVWPPRQVAVAGC